MTAIKDKKFKIYIEAMLSDEIFHRPRRLCSSHRLIRSEDLRTNRARQSVRCSFCRGKSHGRQSNEPWPDDDSPLLYSQSHTRLCPFELLMPHLTS